MTKQKEQTRAQIEDRYKWQLEDLYPTVSAWRKAKKSVESRMTGLDQFQGELTKNAANFLRGLVFYHQLEMELLKLYAYAMMLSDQDTRESLPLGMKQEMMQLETNLKSAASFLEPEILALQTEKLGKFFLQEPDLNIYRQAIDDVFRRRSHTLTPAEEKLIAQAGLMSDTAHESFNILSNADLPYPTVELSDGESVKLDPTHYALYRISPVREDRKRVFESFFSVLKVFSRTFGTQLYGEIKKNVFYKNARNYKSCLESALDRNNIPVPVYETLIDSVNRNFDTLHRYFDLRRKMLDLDQLEFYDTYPSLVKEIDRTYTYDEAKALIRESLSVLGTEYMSALEKSFTNRWIDVFPTPGKKSGAYMEGIAYDTHPYILMNYKNRYSDVSTLTHELGHAMHSYFSNKYQPYVNSQYPIFLAEVASTVNEALLMANMLKNTTTPEIRLSLLGDALEGFRGTLFRQTQFAEYERAIHEKVEAGDAITGDQFTEIYLEIFRKYYGHEKGIMHIADLYGMEWAYIPHFYYNFYVYQYSTSFTAAQAIAEKILSGDRQIIPHYIQFLSSGRSDYAIPTLKKLGIDMTRDEPFLITIRKMNEIMDEIEVLRTADMKRSLGRE